MGVGAYLQSVMMTAEDFAALPQVQQDLIANQPFWVTAAFAIAVFAGFLGAIMLLMRKRVAVRLFLLSLIAVVVQFSSYFIIDEYIDFISSQGWTMPIAIPVIAIALYFFVRHTEKIGILK